MSIKNNRFSCKESKESGRGVKEGLVFESKKPPFTPLIVYNLL